MIKIGRDHSANVKCWRDGHMALRWCAADMLEATKRFRRVNGFTARWPRSYHRAANEVPRSAGHLTRTVWPSCPGMNSMSRAHHA